MNARRAMLLALAAALGLLVALSPATYAQRGGRGGKAAEGGAGRGAAPGTIKETHDGTCPACNEKFSFEDPAPAKCPHCDAPLESSKDKDGNYIFKSTETSENKWKKYLLIGGAVALGLGLLGMLLKYTVFAPAPVKKKKKKKRDEDYDDEDDDRPRKKKRPIDEDEDDDRPRKKKNDFEVVDDDEPPRKPKKPRIVDDE